ncbi:glycosyltransferase family 2 protein [Paenarthrobacter sp. DKR-5]|uniref:glycosyltransferase family A protein n=1 Tax=Paenarthrobacter sp. DKR-5 TaxID=2835535 RepID=UPI001BDCC456|nr:glycosyltransferase family 2 protein [Paenarthrobacter sp. DKR-5]MBT1003028.1 glycosyltransferase family 2 protein [Paenarthrobacter sp. DKR-5]
MTEARAVTVVIAVHQLNRPVRRAAESALLAGLSGQVKVLVMCHGIPSAEVQALLADLPQEDLEIIEFADGIPSPAGPKNAGLDRADTCYVAILDSDDYLEPGALAAWIAQADETGADAVIAPIRMQSGVLDLTPRLRAVRRGRLDPVRDRLAYRTVPFGLMRRSSVEKLGLRLTPGVRTGEDIDFSLHLWFGADRLEMGRPGPRYIMGEDAVERVTSHVLPLAEEFRALGQVLQAGWLKDLRRGARQAVAVKLLRIHVLGALLRRGADFPWVEPDRAALAAAVEEIMAFAPGAERPLSVAERRLVRLARSRHLDREHFAAALRGWPGGYLRTILTPRPWDNLRVESNLRYYVGRKVAALIG